MLGNIGNYRHQSFDSIHNLLQIREYSKPKFDLPSAYSFNPFLSLPLSLSHSLTLPILSQALSPCLFLSHLLSQSQSASFSLKHSLSLSHSISSLPIFIQSIPLSTSLFLTHYLYLNLPHSLSLSCSFSYSLF